MKHAAIVGLILAACGGQADVPAPIELDDPDVDAPEIPDAGVAATDAGSRARAEIPLCPGADTAATGGCQTLVYDPSMGYCNRWHPCR